MTESFDLIVIGGGISGLGVAQESAGRGYRTLLVEKGQCCRGTSDNSMRIIHGGLRYLQTLDLPRTVESLRAQSDLLSAYPGQVKTLPCVMPLARLGLKSRLPVAAAIAFYNRLARWAAPRGNPAKIVSAGFVDEFVPLLKGMAPHGALLWYDALVPKAREFSAYLKYEAEKTGVEILERTRGVRLGGKPGSYELECESGGRAGGFTAPVIVNTAGPWLKRLIVEVPMAPRPVPQAWCKAFNFVLNGQFEEKFAAGVSGGEGRLFFTVPRGRISVVGTFYTPYVGDPDDVEVTEEEAARALGDYRRAMPRVEIGLEDVSAVEVGVLPVKKERPGMPLLYGREQVFDHNGYIEVLSTKYTTFQTQARRVMQKAAARLGPPIPRSASSAAAANG